MGTGPPLSCPGGISWWSGTVRVPNRGKCYSPFVAT